MRPIKFKKYLGDSKWTDFVYPGTFHQWAVGFEVFETGPGNYTYAIVECEDGRVEEVLPTLIMFIDKA